MAKKSAFDGITCPATGQKCVENIEVMERTITLRRWIGGKVKASVCSHECAQRWAKVQNRSIVGDSMTAGKDVKRETIIIFKYHDDGLTHYQS